MHLADVTAQSDDTSAVDTWSQLILELHGIIAEGDSTLSPVSSFWGENEDELEIEEPAIDEVKEVAGEEEKEEEKEAPVAPTTPTKLKLIYPGADGTEKELTIDLSPDDEEDSAGGTAAEKA